MESVNKFIVVLSLLGFISVRNCYGGSLGYGQYGTGGLPGGLRNEDLRSIEGFVSSGLPYSSDGFVYNSGMGPVIVEPNKVTTTRAIPQTSSYFRNLPSVIPEGYEGIASTSFLLGHPIPTSTTFSNPPTTSTTYTSYSPQNVYTTYPSQQQPQHQVQPSSSHLSYSTNLPPPSYQYQPPPPAAEYQRGGPQPQATVTYNSIPTQFPQNGPQTYTRSPFQQFQSQGPQGSQQPQFQVPPPPPQERQQFQPQFQAQPQPQQQQFQPQFQAQPQQQHLPQFQTSPPPQPPPQQFTTSVQPQPYSSSVQPSQYTTSAQPQQQQQQFTTSIQPQPQQFSTSQFTTSVQPQQFTSSGQPQQFQTSPEPQFQRLQTQTFPLNSQQQPQAQQLQQQRAPPSPQNSIRSDLPEKDQWGFDRSLIPTNFIGGTGYRSREELVPNPVVEQTFNSDAELPDHLKNPFYSNSLLAQMLAQESLPAQGERVVGNWDTNKIRGNKIRDLLSGAGFL